MRLAYVPFRIHVPSYVVTLMCNAIGHIRKELQVIQSLESVEILPFQSKELICNKTGKFGFIHAALFFYFLDFRQVKTFH